MSLKHAKERETSEPPLSFNGPECERDEKLGELCQRLRDIADEIERLCEPPQRAERSQPKGLEEVKRRFEETLDRARIRARESKGHKF